MTLATAQHIIRQVHKKDYSYLMAWGLPIIRAAIHTLLIRKHSTRHDVRLANSVSHVISRGIAHA